MFVKWPPKNTEEMLDYGFNWSDDLDFAGESLASSTWDIAGDGLLVVGAELMLAETNETIVWLSGGTAGTTYHATNTITTSGGRTAQQTAKLTVRAVAGGVGA